MVKILCMGGFIVGLLATALNYTIQYFSLEDKVEQERQEISNEI